jgi:hypothetical protein
VGNERAETYLRLLAEVELRRAGDQLRGLDAAGDADQWPHPRMAASTVAESALWTVIRAGQILVAADAIDQEYLGGVAADLLTAITARSRLPNGDRRAGGPYHTLVGSSAGLRPPSGPAGLPPSGSADPAMRVTPIGRTLRVASDRAPSALHLMSLVRTQNEAAIIVVMRMSWPPDGSSTDLEITGAGPHHLPYNQLWAEDDLWTRYTVRFEGDGGTAAWRGVVRLSPAPPAAAGRLDLIGDGTRLVQLPLHPAAAHVVPSVTEPAAISPGERLLVAAAERILASGDARQSHRDTSPGELIAVLTEARVIPANSPLPGQLAALCQRLGAYEDDITVAPAAELPAQWASVIAHQDDPVPAEGAEVSVPLDVVLPDVDGATFVLAGLSIAAGETYLHVVSSGVVTLTDRAGSSWTPVLSWWLGDGAGNWHVATASEPYALEDGVHALRLRLTPPLAAVPGALEVEVTGPATRVRGTAAVQESR